MTKNTPDQNEPSILSRILVFLATVVLFLLVFEFLITQAHKDGKNYDIEMWKYSKELKKISSDPILGHEHIPNKKAILQNTEISINSRGMRGPEPLGPELISKEGIHRVLILGSSITLGWGVDYDKTYPELLQGQLNSESPQSPKYEVLNAGIGNYNTQREVELFLRRLTDLKPDMIILSYFVNDAEIIPPPSNNYLLKNSQLAVMLWSRLGQLKTAFGFNKNLLEHYKSVYQEDYQGWQTVKHSFALLQDYAQKHGIKVIVTMIPDIHVLKPYPFDFIHDKVKTLALESGFLYLDFLDSFKSADPHGLWAMPGDPHPNAFGHELMAKQLYDFLKDRKLIAI
jgi:lysophospholipase L1-like esterase